MSLAAIPAERKRAAAQTVLDPERFARQILGHDVWDGAAAIMRAVDKPRARVAVKACHASSKTFTAAEIALWFVTRYNRAKVVDTAPTWTQVESLFWGEVHKAIAAAKCKYPTPLDTELELTKGERFIQGLSTNEAVKFQGFHADEGGHVLLILDEAPGVKPAIHEAIEGIRAGGDVRILQLGNPVIASGPFYEIFTEHRAGWDTFTIGAFDTPNLAGCTMDDLLRWEREGDEAALDYAPRPYLITRRYVLERWHEWGPEHPMFQSRVLGQFPTQSEEALFSLAWIEAAALREPVDGKGRCVAGLDVGGGGADETSLWVREGGSVLLARHWSLDDPRGEVVAALMPYRNRLDAVNVDSVGIGHGMAEHLADLGFPVRRVNAGSAPRNAEKFANLKAEMYWSARGALERGEVAGLTDQRAQAQLAGIQYRHNSRGRVEIESKDEAKRRGVKSPDRAEGFILCFGLTGPAGKRKDGKKFEGLHQWSKVRA